MKIIEDELTRELRLLINEEFKFTHAADVDPPKIGNHVEEVI